MNKSILFTFLSIVMSQILNAQAPIAPRQDQKLEAHNHTRIDPYYWLKERDAQPVLDYLQAENTFAKSYFDTLQPLVDELLDEFEQRIDPNETSATFIYTGFQ